MKQQQLIAYLNISRALIGVLLFSQIVTFGQICYINNQLNNEKLNAQICAEEMIPNPAPLEIIPEDELR